MKICIVGHGPSLVGAGKGEEIDSYPVVRLKQGWKQCFENPKDYGSRMDYIIASTETLGCLVNDKLKGFKGRYWAYPKYGWYDKRTVIDVEDELDADLEIPLNYINRINWEFRKTAKHPNVSLGMAAILYAARLNPEEIVLAGFDTLLNPELEFSRNNQIPRTGVGEYPNHDWVAENKLLNELIKIPVRAI